MKKHKSRFISLREIAQETGLSFSALNYYANLGLLTVVDRQGNKRLFLKEQVLQSLEQIRQLRKEGYPLRMIRQQLRGQAQ